MRIKGHEIPARKGLLTAASAAVVVVAISAFGRIALRTDLAHSQTSAEKYPSCGSVAVCINGGVNSQFYFGGIVSPKCIQTNGGERNKVGVGSCVSPSSTSMVAQTINAPHFLRPEKNWRKLRAGRWRSRISADFTPHRRQQAASA